MTLVRALRRERRERRERQFVNYPASVSVGERYSSVAGTASLQSDCLKVSCDWQVRFYWNPIARAKEDERLIEEVRVFECLWK